MIDSIFALHKNRVKNTKTNWRNQFKVIRRRRRRRTCLSVKAEGVHSSPHLVSTKTKTN